MAVQPLCFFGSFGLDLKLKIRCLDKYYTGSNKTLLREEGYLVKVKGSQITSVQESLSVLVMELWKTGNTVHLKMTSGYTFAK